MKASIRCFVFDIALAFVKKNISKRKIIDPIFYINIYIYISINTYI